MRVCSPTFRFGRAYPLMMKTSSYSFLNLKHKICEFNTKLAFQIFATSFCISFVFLFCLEHLISIFLSMFIFIADLAALLHKTNSSRIYSFNHLFRTSVFCLPSFPISAFFSRSWLNLMQNANEHIIEMLK